MKNINNTASLNPFHLAFKVKDIESTRKFYVEILGCKEGRFTENWIDFNFFGHQLSGHVSHNIPELDYCGKVDGINVPIPHFGCILLEDDFLAVRQKLERAEIHFIVKPYARYQGQTGEQMTMFVLDLSGNPIEFKSFKKQDEIFAS